MAFYIRLYLASLAAFLVIDLFWLGFVARSFYRKHLSFLMAPTVNWPAAIIFYMLFIAGIVIFVLEPGLKENSLRSTLFRAAMFGLITYATYDLTNLATLKNWPVIVTVVDMLWGSILCMAVSSVGFAVGRWIR